jgi:anti-sigma regulatory factor (Ser/Thr protein kinase)
MPHAVPGTIEVSVMQPSRADSDKDGKAMLDREFGAASLSGLRGAVLECATAAGLTDDRAIDVMLAMHELAANVIRHGAGRGRLQMEVVPGALRCQVSDVGVAGQASPLGAAASRAVSGGPVNSVAVSGGPVPGTRVSGGADPDVMPATAWPVEHGHGLWLVRRTADQVQVTTGPGGAVVSVIFTLPGRVAG